MKGSANIKMDKEIRDQSKILFSKMGLDMTTAVNMFLIQTIKEKSIPFQISTNDKSVEDNFEKLIGMKLKNAEEQELQGKLREFSSFESKVNSKYGF